MSFAKEVKEEVSKIKGNSCCNNYEFMAMLYMNAGIGFSSKGNIIEYSTTNPTIAKRFVELLKSMYNEEIELIAMQNQNLKKNNTYMVKINKADNLIEKYHLLSLDDYDDINDDCCKKAYLRGSFLSSGSINDPTNSYHLEIKCKQNKDAIFIQKLMNEKDLNAKIGKRRNELIVYIKEAQKIADFLNVIGATRSYFKYEDIRLKRQFTNNINRVMNCELANSDKSIQSAMSQLKEIDVINTRKLKIDQKVQEVIDLRFKYQDSSLNELVIHFEEEYGYKITKSGLNHRFRKMHEIYEMIISDSKRNE